MVGVTPLIHSIKWLKCIVGSGNTWWETKNHPSIEDCPWISLMLKVVCKGTALLTPLPVSYSIQVIIFQQRCCW
jgi:hypothetical protein